jgi:brefeldin A-resistance guanine nucleotide exchange factor 1
LIKRVAQVKTKMTCEEFVRNNRGGNDGQDFPRDFLEELFRHIERRAIRIPPAHPAENSLRHNSLPEPIRLGL